MNARKYYNGIFVFLFSCFITAVLMQSKTSFAAYACLDPNAPSLCDPVADPTCLVLDQASTSLDGTDGPGDIYGVTITGEANDGRKECGSVNGNPVLDINGDGIDDIFCTRFQPSTPQICFSPTSCINFPIDNLADAKILLGTNRSVLGDSTQVDNFDTIPAINVTLPLSVDYNGLNDAAFVFSNDLNGDGIGDFLYSSWAESGGRLHSIFESRGEQRRFFVSYGSTGLTAGSTIDLLNSPDLTLKIFDATNPNIFIFGRGFAPNVVSGDVNHDGRTDLIFGFVDGRYTVSSSTCTNCGLNLVLFGTGPCPAAPIPSNEAAPGMNLSCYADASGLIVMGDVRNNPGATGAQIEGAWQSETVVEAIADLDINDAVNDPKIILRSHSLRGYRYGVVGFANISGALYIIDPDIGVDADINPSGKVIGDPGFKIYNLSKQKEHDLDPNLRPRRKPSGLLPEVRMTYGPPNTGLAMGGWTFSAGVLDYNGDGKIDIAATSDSRAGSGTPNAPGGGGTAVTGYLHVISDAFNTIPQPHYSCMWESPQFSQSPTTCSSSPVAATDQPTTTDAECNCNTLAIRMDTVIAADDAGADESFLVNSSEIFTNFIFRGRLDWNEDGKDDFVLVNQFSDGNFNRCGVPFNGRTWSGTNVGPRSGSVSILYGGANNAAVSDNIRTAAYKFLSNYGGGLMDLLGIGDVDGDGKKDIIVEESHGFTSHDPLVQNETNRHSRLYVLFNSAPILPCVPGADPLGDPNGDTDCDAHLNGVDLCPSDYDPRDPQLSASTDFDLDGVPDVCDNCPFDDPDGCVFAEQDGVYVRDDLATQLFVDGGLGTFDTTIDFDASSYLNNSLEQSFILKILFSQEAPNQLNFEDLFGFMGGFRVERDTEAQLDPFFAPSKVHVSMNITADYINAFFAFPEDIIACQLSDGNPDCLSGDPIIVDCFNLINCTLPGDGSAILNFDTNHFSSFKIAPQAPPSDPDRYEIADFTRSHVFVHQNANRVDYYSDISHAFKEDLADLVSQHPNIPVIFALDNDIWYQGKLGDFTVSGQPGNRKLDLVTVQNGRSIDINFKLNNSVNVRFNNANTSSLTLDSDLGATLIIGVKRGKDLLRQVGNPNGGIVKYLE